MLKVRSSCAALETASRAFPILSGLEIAIGQPAVDRAKLALELDLRTSVGKPSLKRKRPLKPDLAILKNEFQLVPFCAHSHMASFHG